MGSSVCAFFAGSRKRHLETSCTASYGEHRLCQLQRQLHVPVTFPNVHNEHGSTAPHPWHESGLTRTFMMFQVFQMHSGAVRAVRTLKLGLRIPFGTMPSKDAVKMYNSRVLQGNVSNPRHSSQQPGHREHKHACQAFLPQPNLGSRKMSCRWHQQDVTEARRGYEWPRDTDSCS